MPDTAEPISKAPTPLGKALAAATVPTKAIDDSYLGRQHDVPMSPEEWVAFAELQSIDETMDDSSDPKSPRPSHAGTSRSRGGQRRDIRTVFGNHSEGEHSPHALQDTA